MENKQLNNPSRSELIKDFVKTNSNYYIKEFQKIGSKPSFSFSFIVLQLDISLFVLPQPLHICCLFKAQWPVQGDFIISPIYVPPAFILPSKSRDARYDWDIN